MKGIKQFYIKVYQNFQEINQEISVVSKFIYVFTGFGKEQFSYSHGK